MPCKECTCVECKPIPKCPVCGGNRIRDTWSSWFIYCPECRKEFSTYLRSNEILWDEIPDGKRAIMQKIMDGWKNEHT
jgi:hypothetical protein